MTKKATPAPPAQAVGPADPSLALDTVRVLSLDGGPAGLLQAHLLGYLEARVPGFLDKTQLFAGTSDGAFVALTLAASLRRGRPATEALARAVAINEAVVRQFKVTAWGVAGFALGVRSLVDGKGMERVLREEFGDRTLGWLLEGDAPGRGRHVMVIAFDAASWAPGLLDNLDADYPKDQTLLDVALSGSALPLLLPAHFSAARQDRLFLDGGVVANNPTMLAMTHMLDLMARTHNTPLARDELSKLRVLSLGGVTATDEAPDTIAGRLLAGLRGARKRLLRSTRSASGEAPWGWISWALRYPNLVPDLFLNGSEGSVDYQCRQLLGPQYLRFAPRMNEFADFLRVMLADPEAVVEQVKALAAAIATAPEFEAVVSYVTSQWMPDGATADSHLPPTAVAATRR